MGNLYIYILTNSFSKKIQKQTLNFAKYHLNTQFLRHAYVEILINVIIMSLKSSCAYI